MLMTAIYVQDASPCRTSAFVCCLSYCTLLQGVLVLLLLPALYIFNRRCRQKYRAKVDHPPLWLAHTAPRSEIDPLVYLPPCLQPNAQGWFFEAGKPWVRWGVPSYNNPNKPGHDAGSLCCA
jgi:hypothetical protein